jgi:hypothetical protein
MSVKVDKRRKSFGEEENSTVYTHHGNRWEIRKNRENS